MSISNCASCGADSYAQAITGITHRRDKTTGSEQLAAVRANGAPANHATPVTGQAVTGVSLSSAALGVLLQAQTVSPVR